MTTKEKMIEVIYEKIADKTPSFGCIIERGSERTQITGTTVFGETRYNLNGWIVPYLKDSDKIIGHPVMIGNILDWIKENNNKLFDDNTEEYIYMNCYRILSKWKQKRLPIENQSEECIEYIYNLIK